jgi:hypothetical protein
MCGVMRGLRRLWVSRDGVEWVGDDCWRFLDWLGEWAMS